MLYIQHVEMRLYHLLVFYTLIHLCVMQGSVPSCLFLVHADERVYPLQKRKKKKGFLLSFPDGRLSASLLLEISTFLQTWEQKEKLSTTDRALRVSHVSPVSLMKVLMLMFGKISNHVVCLSSHSV